MHGCVNLVLNSAWISLSVYYCEQTLIISKACHIFSQPVQFFHIMSKKRTYNSSYQVISTFITSCKQALLLGTYVTLHVTYQYFITRFITTSGSAILCAYTYIKCTLLVCFVNFVTAQNKLAYVHILSPSISGA